MHVLSNDACKFAINLFPITSGPFEDVNLLYFLLKMQIWNGCNVLNIAGNPIKDMNVNLSFLSSGWKVVEWTPRTHRIGKIFKFISEFRIKDLELTPQDLTSGWHCWNSTFACTVQWCMQIAINLFPSPQGHLKMLIYSYFLLKMQIWNGCNVLKIAGNPIKDMNVNLSFLSSGWKVVEWTPPHTQDWKNFKFISEFRIKRFGIDPPGSDIWWTLLKFYFCMYCPMMHANLP